MTTENSNCPTCGSDVVLHVPDTDGGTGYFEPVTNALRARVAELEARDAGWDYDLIKAERDSYREALENIRDSWVSMNDNTHSNTAKAIAEVALRNED